MTTRQALRTVQSEEAAAQDFNNDITAGDAALDAFADAVSGALQANLNDNKTLIQRTRAWAEEQLAHVTKQEEQLQVRLAAADAAYANKVAAAQAERDTIKADVELDLRQVSQPASARGLFRATGKKAKPTVRQLLDGSYERTDDGLDREGDDFYPTPPEPTRAILHAEAERLRDFSRIWEPAAGDGAMVREIERAGHKAFASDLVDRGGGAYVASFYDYKIAPFKAILTNPPFSECGWGNGKARWLKHALDVLDVDYMALLMNWGWPGAGGLRHFYAQHPPARVYLMRWKIDFTGQGAPPMLNAWFVWDKKWQGETVLRMLDRKDAAQAEMFAETAA